MAGYAVAQAGDVDGDGLADILLSAPHNDDAAVSAGKVYLVVGDSLDGSGAFSMATADYLFVGEAESDLSGWAISTAGDVDGDSLDDVLIGAYGGDGDGTNEGKVYLCLATNLDGTTVRSLATAEYRFIGEADDDNAGYSLAGAGDVDGDDLADVLISAYKSDESDVDAGKVFLILASTLDGSGTISLGTTGYSFLGVAADDQAGQAVAGGGDINGDGRPDILISAENNDDAGYDFGKIYLILNGL
jgi:hypothetical protein